VWQLVPPQVFYVFGLVAPNHLEGCRLSQGSNSSSNSSTIGVPLDSASRLYKQQGLLWVARLFFPLVCVGPCPVRRAPFLGRAGAECFAHEGGAQLPLSEGLERTPPPATSAGSCMTGCLRMY
jgi:hypothetical protein